MKTYDVVFKVRVRAENEEDAKVQALEVLNSPGIVHVEVSVEELREYLELLEEMGLKKEFEPVPLIPGGLTYDTKVSPSNTVTKSVRSPLCFSCKHYYEEGSAIQGVRTISQHCKANVSWEHFQSVYAGLSTCQHYKPKPIEKERDGRG